MSYIAYRIIAYTGPATTRCAPDSRFILTESGIEDPNKECLLLEQTCCPDIYEFDYEFGRYIGTLMVKGHAFDHDFEVYKKNSVDAILLDISIL